MAGLHRVKKLEVGLRVAGQEQARVLQQEVSIFCRTELQAILQEAFDAVAPDFFLRIDRLELDLHSFNSVDEFRSRLGERIRQVLNEQLDHARAESIAASMAPQGSRGSLEAENTEVPMTFGAPYLAADIFIHVLKYGVVPWHGTTMNFDDMVDEVIGLCKTDQPFKLQVRTILVDSDRALQRFLLQTRPVSLRRLILLLTEIEEGLVVEVESLVDSLVDSLGRGRMGRDFTLLSRKIFFKNLLSSGTTNNAESGLVGSIVEELITSFIDLSGEDLSQIRSKLSHAGKELKAVLPPRWRTRVLDSLARFTHPVSLEKQAAEGKTHLSTIDDQISCSAEGKAGQDSTGERKLVDGDLADDALQGRVRQLENGQALESLGRHDRLEDDRESAGQRIKKNSQSRGLGSEEAATDEAEGGQQSSPFRNKVPIAVTDTVTRELSIPSEKSGKSGQSEKAAGLAWMSPGSTEEFHIINAGLVLVAPFFGSVFKTLGYLGKDGDFISEDCRVRAVHFSQFLVTGEQHPPECGLMLNKVLCNMDVEVPLERFIELTEDELEAAGEVLDSALEHWTVLKRTTVPVFQRTFLQHEGILNRESTWLLRIERTSVDVLIDTVPWTISIIKHPWMKQPLMVEW